VPVANANSCEKISRMKFPLLLLSVCLSPLFAMADWDLRRFEGRDYVTLDSLAEFYGFPAPPTLLESATAKPSLANLLQIPGALLAVPIVVPGDSILLDSGKQQLEFVLNSRQASINGARCWLSYSVHPQDGKILISRIDLAKIIEPRLRPHKIEGLQPVATVVLDPGHGGHDRGAVSRLGFEKDFTLDVAQRARVLLEKQGYKVVMTRSADIFVPLQERAQIANRIENSIFVSIHFNDARTNPDARGFEIYSMAPRGAPATNDPHPSLANLREEPGNALEVPSAALASSVYAALLGHIPNVDRGLKQARFAVLRLCSVPATLVECGFVSHAGEVALIDSPTWRGQLAEAIVDGIDGYKLLAEQGRAPRTVAEYRSGNAP
jgi:N-acetylmuramoyl-L-alanine amidase